MRLAEPEATHYIRVKPLFIQHTGDIINARHIYAVDHSVAVHIAHQGYLVFDAFRQRTVGTQDECIGTDAHLAEHHHRMLCRFSLQLMGGRDIRHQRYMHEHAVVRPEFTAYLARCFKERLRFDIAHSTADLSNDHIDTVISLGAHTAFYFVGDMRDHLHALSEVFARPLLTQHILVYLARSDISPLAEENVKESLIVANIQISFSPVLSYIYFTMLERVHRAGVNIDIRVQLLLQNMQAAAAQKAPQRRCRKAFAKGRNNAASNENMLCHVLWIIITMFINHGI